MDGEASTGYGQTATEFANALVGGQYDAAHALLTAALGKRLSAADLQASYEEMVEYGAGPIQADGYVHTMDSWPAKEADDVGWAYVSISGSDFSEAVTVIVTREAGTLKIRDIEWGRP